jgi:hypothetical protein
VSWSGIGAVAGKKYVFNITTEQPNKSNTEWTMFYDSGDIDIFTRGVAVMNNHRDPDFGKIYTANDGGPLGTGISIFNADGSFHDPFLVAADNSSGGSFDYGTDAPLFTAMDSLGRLYVTLKDLGKIVRINRDYSTQALIEGLTFPKGIYVEGTGNDFTIYVTADNKILRAKIGTADSFLSAGMETIAEFTDFFPHQIIRDDEGALYATLRTSNDLGSDSKGIRKFDISDTLPVKDSDAVWFLFETSTYIANDLLMDYGSDRAVSTDDILYFCTRADAGNDQDGIWRIDDINAVFPTIQRIITEDILYGGDENINARATIDFDAAGNIVLMENANEHMFFISPPGEGETNQFTTISYDTFMVDAASALVTALDQAPLSYQLNDNYPNPFNPSTIIAFSIAQNEFVEINIFNATGQKVSTLLSKNLAAGSHQVQFDGGKLASGIYYYTIQAGDFRQTKKMVLTK